MTTSLETSSIFELYDTKGRIRDECLGYFTAKAQAEAHQEILKRFLECQRTGISKSVIAQRLGKRPEQVTRWIATPGNWTIETYAQLMLALDGIALFDSMSLKEVSLKIKKSPSADIDFSENQTATNRVTLSLTFESSETV